MHRHLRILVGITLAVGLVGSGRALAADDFPSTAASQNSTASINGRDPIPGGESLTLQEDFGARPRFARNDFEIGVGLQGFTAWGHHGADSIVLLTTDVSFFVRRHLSVGLEAGLAPGTYDSGNDSSDENGGDNSDNSDGARLRMRASEELALVRWHAVIRRDISFFADAGVGGLHATRFFPEGGKSDNWLATAGAGVYYRIGGRCYFRVGCRFARLSGGDLFASRNAREASDGIQYYGGFSIEP